MTAVNGSGLGRISFTFSGSGQPQVDVTRGTPPFHADPSYRLMSVHGRAFWVVVFHGGTGVDPNGHLTYTGPGELRPAGSPVVDVVRLGDFEAVSSWVIGADSASCLSVVTSAHRIEVRITKKG